LYSYGGRNPLKHVDPSGLEVVFSPVLQKSPVFQEALALFKKTKEGQRILARMEASGAKVTLSAGRVWGEVPKTGWKGEALGQSQLSSKTDSASITINLTRHQKRFADKETLILELADTIHHEFRHVEGNMLNNNKDMVHVRKFLDTLGDTVDRMKLPRGSLDPRLRMGEEVHDGLDVNSDDPYNQEFRKQATTQQVKAQLRSHSDPSIRAVADKFPD
jgi:hypothetical protein